MSNAQDNTQAPTGSPQHQMTRPEKILLAFFREIFSENQELINFMPKNEFFYSEDMERTDRMIIDIQNLYQQNHGGHMPALVVQWGGSAQNAYMMDDRLSHDWNGTMRFHGVHNHQFTLHCMAREVGQSKILMSLVDWALFGFKKVLLQMGVDQLFPRQFSAPQSFDFKGEGGTIQGFDGFVSFSMNVPVHAFLDFGGQTIEEVRSEIKHIIGCSFDPPPEHFFTQESVIL